MVIKILIILFACFALSRVVLQFRAKKVTTREFLFWLLFWGIAILVAVYPDLASRVALFLGVGRGADVVVYLALLLLFYLLFRFLVRIERIEQDVTKIVTTLAIDEEKKKGERR